jgi:hypothetical protein
MQWGNVKRAPCRCIFAGFRLVTVLTACTKLASKFDVSPTEVLASVVGDRVVTSLRGVNIRADIFSDALHTMLAFTESPSVVFIFVLLELTCTVRLQVCSDAEAVRILKQGSEANIAPSSLAVTV